MPTDAQIEAVMRQLHQESELILQEIKSQQHEQIAFKNLDPRLSLDQMEHIVNGFVEEQLSARVNWEGFTSEQRYEVVASVVREDPPECWMDCLGAKSSPDVIDQAKEMMHTIQEVYTKENPAELYSSEHADAGVIREHLTGEFDGPGWDELDRETKEQLLRRGLAEFVPDLHEDDYSPLVVEHLEFQEQTDTRLMPDEFSRLLAEQRDDAAQRPLIEKGVRYEDAPEAKRSDFDRMLDEYAARGSGTKSREKGPER